MIYNVIGLMSGSSLDGLDIAYVQLTEQRGQWSYAFMATACVPYNEEWSKQLLHASSAQVPDYLRLHTSYGHYLGQQVNAFIEKHALHHTVHFIASHGHTVFHEPATQTTAQIGCGAAIAAETGLPVISDLRAIDVALGGQGAPIVPIGDKLLFGQYPYLLNLGGIANLTLQQGENRLAFDVGPANAVLNRLALREGKAYDENGQLAASGNVISELVENLHSGAYFRLSAPKSLSNEQALLLGSAVLENKTETTADLSRSFCQHLAQQIAEATLRYGNGGGQMLITGGGAHHAFLISLLREKLLPAGIEVVIPQKELIDYKEALVMALIGTLRWREEENVLQSITGASRNSVGGALWMS